VRSGSSTASISSGVAPYRRAAHHRVEVRFVAFERRERVGRSRSTELGAPLPRAIEEVVAMRDLRLEEGGLGRVEPRVLGHAHVDRVAHLAAIVAAREEEARVVQRLHPVERPRRRLDGIEQHRLGCAQIETAFEHRRALERPERARVEQRERPLDRDRELALPLFPTAREQREARAEALEQHARGHHREPRGRELDRERPAVELAHDVAHRDDLVVAHLAADPRPRAPVDEEPHRVRRFDHRSVALARARHRERLERVHELATEPQALPRGREHRDLGRPEEEDLERRRPGRELLEVVEHQHQRARGREHARDEGHVEGASLVAREVDRSRDPERDLVAAPRIGEIDEHRRSIAARGACEHVERERRLADPRRPGDGDEPVPLFEQLHDRGDVVVAPEERSADRTAGALITDSVS
jgi:hypothetical protein